jgi:hypothetical protein
LVVVNIVGSGEALGALVILLPMVLIGWSHVWGDQATTIKFDRPPGAMTITRFSLRLLGHWPFLRQTIVLRYGDVSVDTGSSTATVQTQLSPTQVRSERKTFYYVRLARRGGKAIKLYEQQDAEKARRIERALLARLPPQRPRAERDALRLLGVPGSRPGRPRPLDPGRAKPRRFL